MKQAGMQNDSVRYHCSSCGCDSFFKITAENESIYQVKKNQLIGRLDAGILNWQTTSWDYLKKDILELRANYEAAKTDIHLNMGIIACLTYGFHDINAETYKECKHIFKIAEKIYKNEQKALKKQADKKMHEDVVAYKEYRKQYKKCRNEYRSTKLMWKLVYMVAKKVIFH